MVRILTVLLVCLSVATPAHAESPPNSEMLLGNTAMVRALCEYGNDDMVILCETYLQGLTAGHATVAEARQGSSLYCAPEMLQPNHVRHVWFAWLTDNRQAYDLPVAITVFAALAERYPCNR